MGKTLFVFTDASYSSEHDMAVIGHLILDRAPEKILPHETSLRFSLQSISETSNIRAELRGALSALNAISSSDKVVLYTDCESICNLPKRRENLEKRKFISRKQFVPHRNADLYREFYLLFDKVQPEIVWVKGHSRSRAPIDQFFAQLDQRVRKELRSAISKMK